MVILSFYDVTSGLRRHLAVEIGKLPILANENSYITRERYAIDSKLVLNINGKPWSLYRLVTPLPVSDITELVKRRNRCEL
jgi:hypothetical protein